MQTSIRFGTDGWRGIIADDFTFDNVRACAQGVASYLQRQGVWQKGLVVGYDTRFASEQFANVAAEVLAANDVPVYLCEQVTPTPVVSFSIKEKEAAGAIIITASHNPARYHGFKFRPQYAGAASESVLAGIQAGVDAVLRGELAVARMSFSAASRVGLIQTFDPRPAYLEHIGSLVDLDQIRTSALRVAVDPLYGAGMGYFPALLAGGQVWVKEIHAERNPSFPGIRAPEPEPANLSALRETVQAERADIGLATDGDADRLALVDEAGQSVENFEVYPLLLYYLLAVRGLRGPVVKTVATSSLVDRVAERFGVPVHTTGVGFKHIAPTMVRTKAIMGGEESGGYAFGDHLPERDGILAGLRVLDLMVQSGKPLSQLLNELRAEFGVYHYQRNDLPFAGSIRERVSLAFGESYPKQVADIPVVGVRTEDGLRLDLADGSWVLLRLSGTEPIIRICAESPSEERLRHIMTKSLDFVGLEL